MNTEPTSPPPDPARMWFYIDISSDTPVQRGPVPESFLKDRAHSGRIARDTPVWREGMEAWQSLETVIEVKEGESETPEAPALLPTNSQEKKNNGVAGWMASAIGVVFIIIVALIAKGVGGEVGRYAGEKITESVSKQDVGQFLEEFARETNPTLPMMINDHVRLDRVTVNPNTATILYEYTFLKITASTVDRNIMAQASADVRRSATNDPSVRWLVDNGATVHYRYSGYDRSYIDTVTINPTRSR